MATAIAADFLSAITDTKSPEIKQLLDLRDQLLRDPGMKKHAESALDGWSATRERQGVLLYLLGRTERALAVLETEASAPWGKHFLARALVDAGFFARAEELLSAEWKGGKSLETGLPLFRALVMQGKLDEAEKILKGIKEDTPAVQAARIEVLMRDGRLQEAMDLVVPLQEQHTGDRHVAFVYAQVAQAAGDDDAARRAYEAIAQTPPVSADVLINLGTLYEDEGLWDLAIKCYETVLREYPWHRRAKLFKRDAEASKNMYYDEDRERKEDKRLQILRTPVTDFELSVRSRNCLQKMKIDTLGDLILKTETELLSYKNFGETSLQEIKAILGSKGLRLGMRTEEALAYAPPEDGSVPVPPEEDHLTQSIDTLELSVRSRRCMERLGIKTLGDLLQKTEAELLAAPNFGQTSLNEVRQKLAELGISLAS
ncbi:MAG: tetratricopeptide repeat protein [Planctomycetes bacterium]|nr:tetratricopeptide repeat protein [Planctomycetota bacterium]MCW8134846.1 tetratricopeptide repeat protein [Planctomycetota bacterium]